MPELTFLSVILLVINRTSAKTLQVPKYSDQDCSSIFFSAIHIIS